MEIARAVQNWEPTKAARAMAPALMATAVVGWSSLLDWMRKVLPVVTSWRSLLSTTVLLSSSTG